ncbi:MAG TPA: efflux RND transporter periplasmic adaptor subunit [Desulfobacteraceae bacterium]|nr:efflux RND transporter periplasmic adaptor subunit [Desulfobacteraceae bacterium]
MKTGGNKRISLPLVLAAAIVLGLIVLVLMQQRDQEGDRARRTDAAPVEVAPIAFGPIELRRTFSGTLEPRAEFVVAPKVSGHVERLNVRLADPVRRGQVVAELDDDEYVQAVNQARADLAVTKANLAEAESTLEKAVREFERIKTLHQRGVASDSQLDESMAERSARQARLEVARAQVVRAEASLETANIRLGYTKVKADWTGGDDIRLVAERYVDEGQTVSANAELLLIVELDPITGVIFVSEKEYARLRPGQEVSLGTDAYPAERFQGRIERIAPVFREATRQARVELTIDNPEMRLKPGMFIRATVIPDHREEAVIVPEQALTHREDQIGIFVVDEEAMTVAWHPVQVGIREGDRVQVSNGDLRGRVVVLGQHLVDDGSPIIIPAEEKGLDAAGAADGLR